ncbi:[FeFe] hydrogenase H-cluster radical SAM maturase HydE [Pseudobacteroides cellulosolvens]|uniref:(FeFe)-hydrogenase maturation HydE, radical SAM n=1 Tax=Pseudobacteroides cellulosolvens ATCC 35603 = DSM 2933 TaxID=398512 RepID=A0A0L6JI40_9FIRM|nr:[FeFe] hydrogenase H-cluster radical SAM maturase HydE [Pseudobacteroides cellulosolvens]KNY25399.1 (FeFe)-hydrogenase maturation HydE, radical SAM [Pseudobacteroides cellulosolvens ATCC 35603 = DSM 2933]
MENKDFLIVAHNTAGMLLINKTLQNENINTDLVPAPPQTGTICAIVVKIKGNDLEASKGILEKENVPYRDIIEDRKLKLQGLIDEKLGIAVSNEFLSVLKKIENGDELERNDIVYLLKTDKPKEVDVIFSTADRIRKEMVGDVVEIRGAIEFSNYCCKSCSYCGINAGNRSVARYRMSEEEILKVVDSLHEAGIKTVILQSGEDPLWSTERIIKLIRAIKERTGMRITLSVGERTKAEYEELKANGADNFLLKIETTNRKIFKEVHPDDDYDRRIQCSKWLKELGYINGSGNIIGLPGQEIEDIAGDIMYFKEMGINMIGIGPFIPAKGTPLEHLPHGDIKLTVRTVAVTRIVCKKVYIPSTTALASLDKDAQVWALNAGANTIMLINTPEIYRGSYRIYDNKNMVDMESAIYAVRKTGRKLPAYLRYS